VRVYLAAPYAARAQVRTYRDELVRVGFSVTSSWLDETHEIGSGTVGAATDLPPDDVAAHASIDLYDIDRSDLLVVLTADQSDMVGGTGTSGGRHVETGYAIGKGLPVLVVGEPENVFHRLGRACTVVPNWHEAVIELSSRLVENRRPRVCIEGSS
jgi:nucleoside 2-deoxyribosyltransferase